MKNTNWNHSICKMWWGTRGAKFLIFLSAVVLLGARVGVAQANPAANDVAQAQTTLPMVPGAALTTVTPEPGYFTEPGIAVDPNHPDNVVAVYQDNAHAAYSTDAGKTWTIAKGVASKDYRVSGDVSTTFDNQGHAFISYIAFDKLGTFNYWGHDANRNGIYIRRSMDGGKDWEESDIPVSAQPQEPGIPFEDKPYIVADNSHGPDAGNLYIGWTRWTLTNSELLFVRSTDDGKTWSKPIEIDNGPGLPRDDNGALEGFAAVVGPDSTVYAVWCDGNHLVLTESHDGGQTFSRTRNIIDTAPIMFKVDAVARSNGFPQIGIDPRGGKKGGRMYVTWSDYRNGDVDVFCATSEDHGEHVEPGTAREYGRGARRRGSIFSVDGGGSGGWIGERGVLRPPRRSRKPQANGDAGAIGRWRKNVCELCVERAGVRRAGSFHRRLHGNCGARRARLRSVDRKAGERQRSRASAGTK